MKWPFVSHNFHEAMVALLTAQVTELREERKILLDRLGTLGLGGPLFSTVQQDAVENAIEATEGIDPEQELADQLIRLRRRPSRLADEMSRQIGRQQAKRYERPGIARIPQTSRIQAELDDAEALGRTGSPARASAE